LLTCLFGSAYGQRGYTDFGEFWDETAKFNVRYTISFDDMVAGADASVRGITTILAEGLASDGGSVEHLMPIAANAFTPYSAPNTLGAAENNQFLAGNGDKVMFTFARPIYAFGLYLIGNPSPTGDPPIPFWRMRTDLGAEVFSATEPLSSLDHGNDVYFLGIVSPEPFTQVELFSDNDPAAVFSFNIDNAIWCMNAYQADLAGAKSLPTGTEILISDLIVTRAHSDRFNIEKADRSSGIAVCGIGASKGRAITLLGTLAMTSPDNERVINLLQIISQTASTAPRPLGMTIRSVGGGAPNGLQIGCEESVGPNNIGLDVTITGRVTAVASDLSWMTVDDGAGRASGIGSPGVCVVGAIGDRREGELVRLSGSASLFESVGKYYPLIRVAHGKDLFAFPIKR
jgi:hypothetical protein